MSSMVLLLNTACNEAEAHSKFITIITSVPLTGITLLGYLSLSVCLWLETLFSAPCLCLASSDCDLFNVQKCSTSSQVHTDQAGVIVHSVDPKGFIALRLTIYYVWLWWTTDFHTFSLLCLEWYEALLSVNL